MKKFSVILLLLASACSPVYVPNARNAPLFTKSGEFQGSIQFINGLDVQGAVSVTDHIGLMGNFSYEKRDSAQTNFYDEDNYHYHRFFEGGIGYFESVGKWTFEVFGGYGRGVAAGEGDSYWISNFGSHSKGKYERYFLQPTFGFNKKVVHIAFVPRFALVDFKEFREPNGVIHKDRFDPTFFFEPAVVGKVNLLENRLFFTFQAGFSIPSGFNTYFDYRVGQITTGLGFRIGAAKRDRDAVIEDTQR